MRFNFSKNHKKYKKIKKIFFLSKNYPLVHKLSYMFSKKNNFLFFRPQKLFFRFSAKSQKTHRTPVTVTLTVTVKNFSLGNVTKT